MPPKPPRTRRPPAPAAPSAEDAALFRDAIGTVRPLAPDADRAELAPPRPRPEARQRAADEQAALRTSREDPFAVAPAPGEELGWRRDEVSPRLLRRLKRGDYAVQDEIVLHALGVDAAADLLRRFLADARRQRHLCVRVVHGKGLRSASGVPLLKAMAYRLLRQRGDVLAFASAPPAQGGTGAVLVLLAPPRS